MENIQTWLEFGSLGVLVYLVVLFLRHMDRLHQRNQEITRQTQTWFERREDEITQRLEGIVTDYRSVSLEQATLLRRVCEILERVEARLHVLERTEENRQ